MRESGVIRAEMTRHPVLPLHPATRGGLIEAASGWIRWCCGGGRAARRGCVDFVHESCTRTALDSKTGYYELIGCCRKFLHINDYNPSFAR